MDWVILGILGALILVFLFFKQPIMEYIRVPVGILGMNMGRYGYLTFYIFWFMKPKYVLVDSQEKFFKKVNCNKISTDEANNLLKTGDLIFFSGRNSNNAYIGAKWASNSIVNHIGIILEEQGNPWILEMVQSGMRFVPLPEVLSVYDADIIFMRRLVGSDRELLKEKITELMFETQSKSHDRVDNSGILEMIKAILDPQLPFSNRDLLRNNRNLEKLFCSELVAESYMRAGLLPDDLGNDHPDSNEYIPTDFTTLNPRRNQESYLINNMSNGFKLLTEEFIEFNQQEIKRLRKHEIIFP
jgi:hypothetical protein